MISQRRVQSRLLYDPETGTFRWRRNRKPAGTRDAGGVLYITLDGTRYRASRLAVLHTDGSLPETVSHLDGDRTNLRRGNLVPSEEVVKPRVMFDPADYPDYEFTPRPVRKHPPARGRRTTDVAEQPARPPRYPSPRYNLRRNDGVKRIVSLDSIKDALGLLENPEPEPLPAHWILMPRLPGYAIDPSHKHGSYLLRYSSPFSSKFSPSKPHPVRITEGFYQRFRIRDPELTGRAMTLSMDKLAQFAGLRPAQLLARISKHRFAKNNS